MDRKASLPELRNPVMVAAFEGWSDAGGAASTALQHVMAQWGGELVLEVDPETYYDFQVARPRTAVVDGRRQLVWPSVRVFRSQVPSTEDDLLLVTGEEPSGHWRSLCTEVLDLAKAAGVQRLVTLGALLADTPHTRNPHVSATSPDAGLRRRFEVPSSTYEGPLGITSVLAQFATSVGIPSISAWVPVPHYASNPPSPKATMALLGWLEQHVGGWIDLGDLPEAASVWSRVVDELSEGDEDISEYIANLEQAADAALSAEASGDELAREFEAYLRRHHDPGSGKGPQTPGA